MKSILNLANIFIAMMIVYALLAACGLIFKDHRKIIGCLFGTFLIVFIILITISSFVG